jgi:hypothetical protein
MQRRSNAAVILRRAHSYVFALKEGQAELLAVKENQPTLHRNVQEFFADARKERRSLEDAAKWKDLRALGMIEPTRTEVLSGKTSCEPRYCITNPPHVSAARLNALVRGHHGFLAGDRGLHRIVRLCTRRPRSDVTPTYSVPFHYRTDRPVWSSWTAGLCGSPARPLAGP